MGRWCLVAVIALCWAYSASASVEGVWRDACKDGECYGGTMSLCLDKDTVYGRYSDIGFLVGIVEKKTVKGYWFEAGYSQKNHGGFEWRFTLEDQSEFTGSWWFSDRPCDRFGWSSQKTVNVPPSPQECGIPSDSNRKTSSWTPRTFPFIYSHGSFRRAIRRELGE